MQLFQGMGDQLVDLVKGNHIGDILASNFRKQMGYRPSPSEIRSWKNSLREMSFVMEDESLYDAGVVVEYKLPYSNRRLDIMLMGENDLQENAVIVELKQWEKAFYSGIANCVELYQNEERLHPSAQAGGYAEYLNGNQTAFYKSEDNLNPVHLEACSFVHNARRDLCGDLLSSYYSDILGKYPLFTGDMRQEFGKYLNGYLSNGNGEKILKKVTESKFRPSKKLLENTARIIEGNPVFTLLDEQQLVFNVVLSEIKKDHVTNPKTVVIVVGGPGTGKSVIAIRLLAALAKEHYNVMHCTGSAAFTTNLRAQVGNSSSAFFKYFNSFTSTKDNTFDVLIADEAHRIRTSSNSRFTKRSERSKKPQIEELIDVARVSVFLLDHNQIVRPGEIGSPELIDSIAKMKGANVYRIDLNTQFRCSGSSAYIDWLDHVLNIGGKPDTSWKQNDEYEFKIVDSPEELEVRIKEKVEEGETARIVAGFCWPWSDPKPDKSLVSDVQIGSWSRPWNRKRKGAYSPLRDPYTIWATMPQGLEQVGCIYSAQGFEFDYVGVIFGNDIIWNEETQAWYGKKENSYDSIVKRERDNFERLILHTYKVLLSRGMKGTYVCFLDPATRKHFEKMLEDEVA